ncbi:hypothetical protein V8D89_003891 [Ganoderma adspersum]
MGNNTSTGRPGLDSRSRLPSDRAYRDQPRAYTTRGKKSKYDRDYYDDDGYGEDYLPQVAYAPGGYPQMTYGPAPYLNPHGQYLPAQQMLFPPQPQIQPGITPVIPGMAMNGAMPIAGNPFPGPAMNMGPTMPEPQLVVPPPGQAGSADGPVIPPLPSGRRGRAATPYMHPGQAWDSSSEEDDELTEEARARLQPPLRPGQYGPFDPVRNRNRGNTPQPILQRNGDGPGGRRHRRAESSPAYINDSPPFDDPSQPRVIPPNFMGGPPFPNHPGVQPMPMPGWPPQPDMGMGGMPQPHQQQQQQPQPQPQSQPQPQPAEPELPPYRPRPFEPIQRSNNPLPAPPRDILHSSPYAKLLEDLRRPVDEASLKAKMAAAPAIHTVGAVNIASQPVPGHHHAYQPGTRSGGTKEKKKKGLFRSLSSRLAGSSSRKVEEEHDAAPAPQDHVHPHMQTFVGGQAVAVYPVVQHMPDGSMALVYNHPPVGPDGMPVPVPMPVSVAAAPPPPVLSPGSAGGMPGYVPSATPASAALNVVTPPAPVMEPPPRMPTPRMPTPQPTPPPPVVKIRRRGSLEGLLHFSLDKVHYGHRSYPTGVHLFEALKFLGGGRDDLAERVRGCGTPEEAVAVAEGLREYWRGDWEEVKLEMLENVLYTKFVQHATLRQMLMATGGADLVFADPDVVWGDGGIGQGLNLLGRALMQVRARLRAEGLDT